MKNIACGLTLVAFALSVPVAEAEQPIDCGYPLNQSERTYCANEALKTAEENMGKSYDQALAKMGELDETLPDHLKGSPAALKDAQQAWLEFREKDCTAYSFPFRGGTRGEELYRGCMIVMTMQRTDELNSMLDDYN